MICDGREDPRWSVWASGSSRSGRPARAHLPLPARVAGAVRHRGRLHRGDMTPASSRWVVLGASTAVNALAWSVRSTFALFYVAMLAELAWGRGATALGYSLSWLGFVVFAPVAGWLFDRWGARATVTLGGVLLGAALALTGRVTSAAEYYVWF